MDLGFFYLVDKEKNGFTVLTKENSKKKDDVVKEPLDYWFRRDFDNKGEPTLEENLGYTFNNPELLAHALKHSSSFEGKEVPHSECNERLEFLGDAVCNMLVTEYLYKTYPEASEGEMTSMKGTIVSGHAWAQTAAIWKLGKFIRVGKGVAVGGGRFSENIVADAFEAVLGAVFLDGGLAEVLKIMERFHWPRIPEMLHATDFTNYKSLLLESLEKADYVAEHGAITVEFRVVGETGPEHERIFETEVFLNGVSYGIGKGTSKKKSEQDVSRIALEKLAAEEALEKSETATEENPLDSDLQESVES